MADKKVQVLEHLFHSSDPSSVDYFLFRRVKEELARICLTPEHFKKISEGIIQNISIEESTIVFRRWLDHSNKCRRLNIGYIKK
jgi:hypothetical protein